MFGKLKLKSKLSSFFNTQKLVNTQNPDEMVQENLIGNAEREIVLAYLRAEDPTNADDPINSLEESVAWADEGEFIRYNYVVLKGAPEPKWVIDAANDSKAQLAAVEEIRTVYDISYPSGEAVFRSKNQSFWPAWGFDEDEAWKNQKYGMSTIDM